MPSKGILITGTDTGVGKTFVACGIAAALRRRGLTVAPLKPAETGCEWNSQSQTLVPADALLLQEASQTKAPLETICPYRYRTPVAPAVAAELEGPAIDLEKVQRCYATLTSSHEVVLLETAGGILVPLTEKFHYGDLAHLLNLPVLLVAGSKLGAINHTLLTLSFLEQSGLRVAGCVVNHCTAEITPAIETNVDMLIKLGSTPLFVLPHFPDGKRSWNSNEFDELGRQLVGYKVR